MAFNLRNRHFFESCWILPPRKSKFLLDLSLDLKKARYAGLEQTALNGQKHRPYF